ncbi:hypothetical protein GCM10011358_07860 [Sinisalibacter lacisalsi]|uniref:ABC transporter domain-containing protein n=2 Tax=Sinisalibacter lacisalsi TaxID=1526570 RepID=A0ABQ1QI73_9RHOB|nr:hypothetical protein GCM10011358_07860 [Sinisalibacter lacisalsi]
MLEVKDLKAAYGQHPALTGVSLRVDPGEIVVILGANGAGKSTLLKAVSGICEGKVEGTVRLAGTDLLGMPPNRIVEEGLALVPEGRGVFPDLTVAENLSLGAYTPRAREEEAGSLDRVLRLFPKLGERRGQVVRTMSGGEQQMVAIGRAMMSNPVYLTLDEPSLGLSPLLCKELFQSLVTVKDAGIGVLLVEQNARQSLAIADRAYLLENGQIVHEGKAAELRNDPAVQAAYLGGAQSAGLPPTAASPARQPAPAAAQAPSPAERPAPPRPSGPSPDEIAVSALASLASPPPRAPAPPTAPAASAPAPRPQKAEPPRKSAPPPSNPPRSLPDGLPGGLSLSDLVAEASAASRARYGGASPPPPPSPATTRPVASYTVPALDTAALTGASHDRLNAILTEIETAAAQARAWRPDPARKTGR